MERIENGWLDDTPVEDSVLRRFLHAQVGVGDVVARRPSAHGDGVAAVDSGGPVAFYNQAVALRPVTAVDDPLLDAAEATLSVAHAEGRGHTLLSAWPTPDLSARGWYLAGHPMFVCRSPGPVAWELAAGVEVVEATTLEQVAEAERVLVEGYPLPSGAGAAPGTLLPRDDRLGIRIAYVEGVPAGVGLVHVAAGVVNLCTAATLPIARRRGAWAALVRARVALRPDLPAVAFTSDDSRPGFVALGFLPITRFTLWARGPLV